MSVRVVARIRPLLKAELDRDVIVEAASSSPSPSQDAEETNKNVVKIPNPKNASEDFRFQFNSVYDKLSKQEELFQDEVAPTVKHLFQGLDVTLFAYGVTGTGKTHTMRGGKSLAERGVIPRMLSGIYRRSKKLEKDSNGATSVEVAMSYYEIYNDRVFDLFEAPEKRTPTGLPLREQNGKTIVVGLTERPCSTLKEFEHLYDQANVNRSTSATKLNAHSSRSHAILRVRVTITTGEESRVSTASAIDLAGSEDNRRTDNGKERLVESASINKSLFVLAQCVEAISRKSSRIPYRESKMTRILSLGQNNGITIMILNLAPVRSYHLDTLSSLNFANRTKTIQTKEIENEPIFKGPSRPPPGVHGHSIQRQPLRPLTSSSSNSRNVVNPPKNSNTNSKPAKAFCVYADKSHATSGGRQSGDLKRRLEPSTRSSVGRLSKTPRLGDNNRKQEKTVEEIVERKVEEILAARALNEASKPLVEDISEQVQKRLEMLEQKIEKKQDARAEGLTYLLMAKQHHVRGEELSALKMYQLAQPFFPDNERLANKLQTLESKLRAKREVLPSPGRPLSSISATSHNAGLEPSWTTATLPKPATRPRKIITSQEDDDDDDNDNDHEYHPEHETSDPNDEDEDFTYKRSQPRQPHSRLRTGTARVAVFRDLSANAGATTIAPSPAETDNSSDPGIQTPRTRQILHIINTRDLPRLKALKGVGTKKAEIIMDGLAHERAPSAVDDDDGEWGHITTLQEVAEMRGVGPKTVENMRVGVVL